MVLSRITRGEEGGGELAFFFIFHAQHASVWNEKLSGTVIGRLEILNGC